MAKIVYLGMIGDIMHPGLINIINEGTKYGDVMIGLFTDKVTNSARMSSRISRVYRWSFRKMNGAMSKT